MPNINTVSLSHAGNHFVAHNTGRIMGWLDGGLLEFRKARRLDRMDIRGLRENLLTSSPQSSRHPPSVYDTNYTEQRRVQLGLYDKPDETRGACAALARLCPLHIFLCSDRH